MVRPRYLSRFFPWALAAVREASKERARQINVAMSALLGVAIGSFDDLLAQADAKDLVDVEGGLVAYKSLSVLNAKARVLPVWNGFDLLAQQVSPGEMRELEPDLARDVAGGIFFPNAGRCIQPKRLGLRYLDRLVRGGGRVLRQEAIGVGTASDRVSVRLVDGTQLRSARIVICTGFEGRPLADLLPFRLPLAAERGYHLMLPTPNVRLRRPVVFGEAHFAATSMQDGLRLAGSAEFAAPHAPANMARAEMLLPLAKAFLPGLDGREARPWMGVRPTLPDGMPAIGELKSRTGVFYAVGHSHNGLTTSAITARCISALIAGKKPPVDLSPFRVERFQH